MEVENAPDPWQDLEILEMVQEALCLLWVDLGDLAILVAWTEMGENVFHTMACEELLKFLNLLAVSETLLIRTTFGKPGVISEPAMLNPDPV